ncbi:MAG TPA: diguanylate cyclase [Candidatus Acidoferrum sp.]
MHYRALAGNLSFGICRCSREGRFLEVNEAMMRMLGYDSKEELLAKNLMEDMIQDPSRRAKLLGHSGVTVPVDPVEWKRKDHSVLKVTLSGREVQGEPSDLGAYEVIAENITQLRELEDHLRRQAASDPLTGLANYRHLVDVIDSEIKRSKRTNREFALLFFDVDGLKQINDRHGHMVGSQASAGSRMFCLRAAGTLTRLRGSAARNLHWSCRKRTRWRPIAWRDAFAKALPMTARGQRFPSVSVCLSIRRTATRLKACCVKRIPGCIRGNCKDCCLLGPSPLSRSSKLFGAALSGLPSAVFC